MYAIRSYYGEPWVGERLSADSGCTGECPARNGCPAGAEYRYPAPILAYHYGVSLAFLREAQSVARAAT